MAGNRKAAEAVILKWVAELDPSGANTAQYHVFFKDMDDKQFDAYMKAIEDGKDYVSLTMPNYGEAKITTMNNIRVGKQLGIKFFQRLWLQDQTTGQVSLTNHEYLVMHLPFRRQIQTLKNKISIPEDNKHVDEMTNQPSGVSKGAAISFPELLVMYAAGQEKAIEEFMKCRGGDSKAMRELDRQIHETGGASLETIAKLGTRAKSTETLSILMKGAHLDNNF